MGLTMIFELYLHKGFTFFVCFFKTKFQVFKMGIKPRTRSEVRTLMGFSLDHYTNTVFEETNHIGFHPVQTATDLVSLFSWEN